MQTTNCLNVRSKFPYRNVPDPVRIEGQVTDLASQRILLLVHGFANSEERAHSSYEKFQAALTAATGYPSGTWGMVWEFHLAGDYTERRLMSFVTYPERIPVAAQSGDFLARFLHESPYLGDAKTCTLSLTLSVAVSHLKQCWPWNGWAATMMVR